MFKNQVTGDVVVLAEERTNSIGVGFEVELECAKGHFSTDRCDFVFTGVRLVMLPRDGFCEVCGGLASVCMEEPAAVEVR